MKKLVSILLAVGMLASVFTVMASAEAFDEWSMGITDIPNLYIYGQGSVIADENGKIVYGDRGGIGKVAGPEFDLDAIVDECLPYFKDALLKNEWEVYTAKLLEIVDSIYDEVRLDNNGDPQYGTHILPDYDIWPEQYHNRTAANGKYALKSYNYYFDWRLDPFESADVLHAYIKNILASTGKEKVNITSRC